MLMTRRDAIDRFAGFAGFAAFAAPFASQTPPAPPRPPVFKQDLPNVTLDGWEVTVSHVDFAPGRVGQPHQHQGFLFAYVLEGAVVTQVLGEGVPNDERTYRAGEMFYEPIGSTHQVSKNASATQPARLLAINFTKKAAR